MRDDREARKQRARRAFADPADLLHRFGVEITSRVSGGVQCRCLWHDDTNPSQTWKIDDDGVVSGFCTPCRRKRDAIDLAAHKLGTDATGDGLWRAVELLEDMAGIPRPTAPLASRVAPPALKAFADARGIPMDVLEQYGWRGVVHSGRPAYRFPTTTGIDRVKYADGGEPKAAWAAKGGRAHWFNLEHAATVLAPGGRLYLVNGEPSVLACVAEGVAAVCLCVGEGTPPSAALVDTLAERFDAESVVAVVYDNDQPGRDGAYRAVEALRRRFPNAVALDIAPALDGLPKGDVDDLHRRSGADLGKVLADLPQLPNAEASTTVASEAVATDASVELDGDTGKLLSEIEPETIGWVWQWYIPAGKTSLLEGPPDEGKTFLLIDIAARVTVGAAMPFEVVTREPAGVVFLTAEDGLGDTIRPRFEAARGDVSRVRVFEPDDLPSLDARGLERIERAAARVGAKLIVIDPLAAFVPDRVDMNSDHHVRRALAPLSSLAARTGAACIAIRHLTKGGGTNAKYRGGGSIGIIGAARSALLVAPDPSDEERKILACSKHNLGIPVPALAYRLESVGTTARVEWICATAHTTTALLGTSTDEDERSMLEEALDWLRDYMTARGPVGWEDVKDAAKKAGHREHTLRRARGCLGAQKRKDGMRGRWLWQLPSLPNLPTNGPTHNVGKFDDVGQVRDDGANPSPSLVL